MNPIKQGDDLLQYIPQRHPFVMVTALYQHEDKEVVSGLTIEERNVLVNNGLLQEGGLIENMAQTAALYAGLKAAEAGKNAPVGFIAGIKHVLIEELPAVGQSIHTKVAIVDEVMDIQIAQAAVYGEDDRMLAKCELRIFIKKEENAG
ncbi:hypothetical protein C900_02918 [Fulvivirga imtechensis AK7]|uniref:Uncharacterized protein n=1 Tax=Fulvivirga imtechensis AK7 TaxID=1237149 RepID=L8JSZ1_9BACT|nr:hypothetical protein [Fulvivirga imtechensis]ELR71303.1 hypothetical protein C900_02918 [Fulvivirga imtechensis AK7]